MALLVVSGGNPGSLGPQGAQGPQGAPGAQSSQGVPGLNWLGIWIPVTAYQVNDAVFYTAFRSRVDAASFQDDPTIDTGDVVVQTDDGSAAPITTLPSAVGKRVKIELSAAEMNGDNVTVLCTDASGEEWCDLLVNIQTTIDIYPVDIALTVNSGDSADEWTVQWFRNGIPLQAIEVSDPTIRVIDRDTGSDLIAETAMAAVGDGGAAYKYNSSLVLGDGAAAIVEVTATVDSATRTWRKIVSRDS